MAYVEFAQLEVLWLMFYLSITSPCYAWKSHPYSQEEPKGIETSDCLPFKCSSIWSCGLWSKLAIQEELMINFLEWFLHKCSWNFLGAIFSSKIQSAEWPVMIRGPRGNDAMRRRHCWKKPVYKGVHIWQQLGWIEGEREKQSRGKIGKECIWCL